MSPSLVARLSTFAWLVACSGGISGTVADEPVRRARDAVFDERDVEIPVLGTFRLMSVVLSDMPDACTVLDEFYDNANADCAEACEDLGQLAAAELGRDEYWTLAAIFVADPDRVVGDFQWDSNALDAENEFSAGLTRLDIAGVYDLDACVQDCEDDDTVIDDDTYDATGGTWSVTAYTAGEALEGEFSIRFGDEDTLEGSFAASRCDPISDWFGL